MVCLFYFKKKHCLTVILLRIGFFKSAMSETLASKTGVPTPTLINLYKKWAQ